MDKEKIYIANACSIQIAKINEILFNQFSPKDLKIEPEEYYEITNHLTSIQKILANAHKTGFNNE